MKNFLVSAFISLVALYPTIGHGDDNLYSRIDVLERTIHNMQKTLINNLNNKNKSTDNNQDISKSLEDLNEEIKLLRSDLDRLESKIKKYSTQEELFEKNINSKINDVEKNLLQNKINNSSINNKDSYILSNINKEIEIDTSSNNDLETQSTVSENKIAQEYQKAYVILKKQNPNGKPEYEKAISAFQNFINLFPNTPLRGNAYYWIASIYTEEKQYSKAAIDFLNGYKANPKSGRAIDNLLGLASSLIKLNKNKEACSALNKTYNEFPNMNVTNKRYTDDLFKNADCSNDN